MDPARIKELVHVIVGMRRDHHMDGKSIAMCLKNEKNYTREEALKAFQTLGFDAKIDGDRFHIPLQAGAAAVDYIYWPPSKN